MQHVLAACEPLGALVPGPRPLEGKSFYLDEVKSHACGVLTKHIVRLGGRVESFLYKDVNVVITGNRDALTVSSGMGKGQDPPREQKDAGSDAVRRPGTPRAPVCGSRGKALLEKAIRNNDQSRGGVLSSAARSWGVKIVSVDQFMKVVEELNSQRSTHTHHRKEEKNSSVRVVKAGSLKLDFVKVEDSSRKYRPLHCQALEFPMLSYTRRSSPFENPAPVQSGKVKDDEPSKGVSGSEEKTSAAPSPKMSRRKKSLGFCECCQMKYRDQDKHLRSDVHLRFVEEVRNYAVVDRLVVEMDAVFSGCDDPRLTSDSVAPPSGSEQQRKSDAKQPERKHESPRSGEVVPLPQEPPERPVAASPCPSLEVVDGNLKSASNQEFCVSGPRSQEGSGLADGPPECLRPSPGVTSCNHVLDTPSLEASLDHDRGPSTCLGSPKERREETLRDPCAETLVDTSSFRPQIQSLFMKSSDDVNHRKRRRSFTLSPKVSKVRRTNTRSDPTNQRSGVGFDQVQRCEVNDAEGQCGSAEQVPSPEDHVSSQNHQQDELRSPNERPRDPSSDPGPPQLYPFFHDDDAARSHPPFLEPPTLVPVVPLPSTNPTSSTSLMSPSFSSVCIESALVPDAFSPSSSESDWDSGLLSRLATPIGLRSKGGRCELDLGFLLQSPCAGMQDGSYASRLCSVLQPAASSSPAGYGDQNPIYRPIIQSLGV